MDTEATTSKMSLFDEFPTGRSTGTGVVKLKGISLMPPSNLRPKQKFFGREEFCHKFT
jgi:hypothetical protein